MVGAIFLHLEISRVRRRLQCWSSVNNDLERGSKVRRGIAAASGVRGGRVWNSPVAHVVTAGEVEVLQPAEMRRRLGDPTVADSRAAAEGQAGEAPAVARHRHQAGVGELAQQGQRQALELGLLNHLKRRSHDHRGWLDSNALLRTHLSDAAVGEFGAGGEVQLPEPVEG